MSQTENMGSMGYCSSHLLTSYSLTNYRNILTVRSRFLIEIYIQPAAILYFVRLLVS
jgi:hypothetical protein